MRQLSTQSSPSYRAIEAAIGGLSRNKRRDRLIGADLSAALLALLDESTSVEQLESALDCCTLDPVERQVLGLSIRGLSDAMWSGDAVAEPVRHVLGVRASRALLAARCVVEDLAEIVESEDRPHISPEKLRAQFHELDLPAELMLALARFFMAMAAAACIVVAARAEKRLRAPIAAALVKALDDGLAGLMPWMMLVVPGCVSVATRQRLPRLDFQRIFEEHAAALSARKQMVAEARAKVGRTEKASARTKDRRKYASAS